MQETIHVQNICADSPLGSRRRNDVVDYSIKHQYDAGLLALLLVQQLLTSRVQKGESGILNQRGYIN